MTLVFSCKHTSDKVTSKLPYKNQLPQDGLARYWIAQDGLAQDE